MYNCDYFYFTLSYPDSSYETTVFLLIFPISGLNCGKVANICASEPCKNRGTCIQEGSSYYCNCTSGHHGQHCEDIVLPAITSNSAGISSEEIYAILGKHRPT